MQIIDACISNCTTSGQLLATWALLAGQALNDANGTFTSNCKIILGGSDRGLLGGISRTAAAGDCRLNGNGLPSNRSTYPVSAVGNGTVY
jgi:hypothetical protein